MLLYENHPKKIKHSLRINCWIFKSHDSNLNNKTKQISILLSNEQISPIFQLKQKKNQLMCFCWWKGENPNERIKWKWNKVFSNDKVLQKYVNVFRFNTLFFVETTTKYVNFYFFSQSIFFLVSNAKKLNKQRQLKFLFVTSLHFTLKVETVKENFCFYFNAISDMINSKYQNHSYILTYEFYNSNFVFHNICMRICFMIFNVYTSNSCNFLNFNLFYPKISLKQIHIFWRGSALM